MTPTRSADAIGPRPVQPSRQDWPLWQTAGSRQLEQAVLARAAPHALMASAGLGLARLALAIAPRARRVWVAAGPGNNGGDGLVAARLLAAQGLAVRVSLVGDAHRMPADARWALAAAQQAGVAISPGLDGQSEPLAATDLAIDALLGLGASHAPNAAMADAIFRLNQHAAPVLAVDLPSGLCADTGSLLGQTAVVARHTLALLTLKPGLFTGVGRDHAGRVWLDDLGVVAPAGLDIPANAWLLGPEALRALLPGRAHAEHKGSFGEALVLGGAAGMSGAALLAARAALTAGAGRVYLARLDGDTRPDPQRPELMCRSVESVIDAAWLAQATVVCGCGGGDAVRSLLPRVLERAARLVLDADALNAVAGDKGLMTALAARADAGRPSVLTPHPLEAARLLGVAVSVVQADRLRHAQLLADQTRATVVLKGSGTVIAAPGCLPRINATGNARLGTAGSGDVLAGWLGGLWAQQSACRGDAIAYASVWLHGRAAELGDDLISAQPPRLPLRAADLIEAMAQALPSRSA